MSRVAKLMILAAAAATAFFLFSRPQRAPAHAPGDVGIRGVVVDENGKPVRGARVFSGTRGLSEEQAQVARATGFHGMQPETAVPVDSDGTFTAWGKSASRFQITAEAEGRAPVSRAVYPTQGVDEVERFVLTPSSGPVTGVVVNELGVPMSGVLVFAGSEQTKTDAKGQFALKTLSSADPTIMASAPGRSVNYTVTNPNVPIRIEFSAPGRIDGKVLRADGTPAAGVPIFVERLENPDEVPVGEKRRQADRVFSIKRQPQTNSAADGTFSVNVPSETYEVWAEGTGSVAARKGDTNVQLKLP